MPLPTLNCEYDKQNQLSKKLYMIRMYTCTVSSCYVSGLLVISKKIIVVDITFNNCDFLDTLSSASISNWNYIHFQMRFTLLEYLFPMICPLSSKEMLKFSYLIKGKWLKMTWNNLWRSWRSTALLESSVDLILQKLQSRWKVKFCS